MNHIPSLTSIQKHALKKTFNLSIGHAEFEYPAPFSDIFKNLSELYFESLSKPRETIEDEFIQAYFKLANQDGYKLLPRPQLHYATSISIEILANILRLKQLRTAMITPTFDNLADVVRRHVDTPLLPINESSFKNPDVEIDWGTFDALFITLPNNPTGFTLTKDEFTNLAELCAKNKKLLAIDFCFRLTEDSYRSFDQYKILFESGVDFVAYEDSGKIWSVADLKVGLMQSSQRYQEIVKKITLDILLGVSPFILLVLTKLIQLEDPNSMYINRVVAENRAYLRSRMSELHFSVVADSSNSTVEWVLHNRPMSSYELVMALEKRDIFLSPGENYYWHNPEVGKPNLRIVLARAHHEFVACVDALAEALVVIDAKIVRGK